MGWRVQYLNVMAALAMVAVIVHGNVNVTQAGKASDVELILMSAV